MLNDGKTAEIVEFFYPSDRLPQRLDSYVGQTQSLKLSRSKTKVLIESGMVTVNGKKALHHQLLNAGDRVVIKLPLQSQSEMSRANIDLDIIFEDDYLIVVNKPAGLTVHPGAGQSSETLANALINYTDSLSKLSGQDRPGIVHRLDKDTSGLILVAKDDQTHATLQKMFSERRISKVYSAVVCGHLKEEFGKIELPIGRSRKERQKMRVARDKGRAAITEFRMEKRYRLVDFLEVRLHTGRTHQIRVHFAFLGHPVLGDPTYGGRQKWLKSVFSAEKPTAARALDIMPRQALHARILEFAHPVTGRIVKWESPLPKDFRQLLDFFEEVE